MEPLLIQHRQIFLGGLLDLPGVIDDLMDIAVAYLAKLPAQALVVLLLVAVLRQPVLLAHLPLPLPRNGLALLLVLASCRTTASSSSKSFWLFSMRFIFS